VADFLNRENALLLVVDVQRHYNTERLRPIYHTFNRQPVFIMTGE